MNLGRLGVPHRISAIAILVVIVGAFLPWASAFGVSVLGVEGDGLITLTAAIAAAVILAFTTGVLGGTRSPGRASQIALLVLAVIVTIVGIVDMTGFAAVGIYLTLFGGIAWTVGAVWELVAAQQVRSQQQSGQVQAGQQPRQPVFPPTQQQAPFQQPPAGYPAQQQVPPPPGAPAQPAAPWQQQPPAGYPAQQQPPTPPAP